METFSVLLFGIYILILAFTVKSHQTCPRPDFPEKGYYSKKQSQFQPGDSVDYSCEEGYILVGRDKIKCKSDGEWSHPTPFCDPKVVLKNPYAILQTSHQRESPQVTDSNRGTCFGPRKGEKIVVGLEKQKVVYAVRLFLEKGNPKFDILLESKKCGTANYKYLDAGQWVLITCSNNTELSNSVTIQDKSDTVNISAICEIEVYVKEDDGCENPPHQKVRYGFFNVSRTKATLICEEGYKTDSDRLVCENKVWKGNLFCTERLCDPDKNITIPTGGDWTFLEPAKKISAGTRRKLKCSANYKITGYPEVIECLMNGTWTKTNATCVEIEKPKVDTQIIVYICVGVAVTLIIIALLGAIIFIIRKQRDRQVVVIYKSPGEGSVFSGSDGDNSAYYETIHSTATLPSPSPLQLPEILSDGYAMPIDGKGSVKKNFMPSNIAFDSFKQSSLYKY